MEAEDSGGHRGGEQGAETQLCEDSQAVEDTEPVVRTGDGSKDITVTEHHAYVRIGGQQHRVSELTSHLAWLPTYTLVSEEGRRPHGKMAPQRSEYEGATEGASGHAPVLLELHQSQAYRAKLNKQHVGSAIHIHQLLSHPLPVLEAVQAPHAE
jgi:hypothetical protein